MKEVYIDKCKAIFDFQQMLLFLICQGMWVLRSRMILFDERGGIPSQHPGSKETLYYVPIIGRVSINNRKNI